MQAISIVKDRANVNIDNCYRFHGCNGCSGLVVEPLPDVKEVAGSMPGLVKPTS